MNEPRLVFLIRGGPQNIGNRVPRALGLRKAEKRRMLRLKSFSFDVIVPYKSPWLTGCVL